MKQIKNLTREIKQGKIFIYPTDTIYGLGCNAEDKDAVERIKKIKQRDQDKPLSVIAPGFDWINQNLIVDIELKKYLPGPYTIILKKKNPEFMNWVSKSDSLGIRIPDNEFTKEIQKSNVPFITTSVNFSGGDFLKKISNLKPEIKKQVDYIIDAGELTGYPSTLIINGKEVKR